MRVKQDICCQLFYGVFFWQLIGAPPRLEPGVRVLRLRLHRSLPSLKHVEGVLHTIYDYDYVYDYEYEFWIWCHLLTLKVDVVAFTFLLYLSFIRLRVPIPCFSVFHFTPCAVEFDLHPCHFSIRNRDTLIRWGS